MFCCCWLPKLQARCLLCNAKFDTKVSDTFCGKKCEILYTYKDSFASTASTQSFQSKYIIDL